MNLELALLLAELMQRGAVELKNQVGAIGVHMHCACTYIHTYIHTYIRVSFIHAHSCVIVCLYMYSLVQGPDCPASPVICGCKHV